VAQKTTPEALALSARYTERAKRNQHHHHLSPGGYYEQEEKFRKMEEEVAASEKLNLKGYAQGIGSLGGVQKHLVVPLSLIT
jgi:hypothetical protein